MADRTPGLTYQAVYKGMKLLLKAESDIVVDIVGHGGIGKTQLVQNLARDLGYGFYEMTCSLLQPGDLTMPIPKENRIEYYLNPQIQGAVDEAKANPDHKVILFLDEFNRPIAMVQSELMNLVLQRHLMGIQLPDNVIIITAENPSSDTEGFEGNAYATSARDLAINDRTMRIRMGANLDHWVESFADQENESGQANIHPLVKDYLQAEGRQYFIVIDETRDKNPTPRAYERLSHLLYDYEAMGIDPTQIEDDDLLAFLIEGIDGCIGEEAGQVFLSYLENHQGDYISPKEIIDLDSPDLPESIKERFLKMPAIRKKRIIQDLTQSLLDHKKHIKDPDLLSRYVDLFLLADPDLIYSLVTRLMQAEAGSALEELRAGLSEDERFIDKAYAITMASRSDLEDND